MSAAERTSEASRAEQATNERCERMDEWPESGLLALLDHSAFMQIEFLRCVRCSGDNELEDVHPLGRLNAIKFKMLFTARKQDLRKISFFRNSHFQEKPFGKLLVFSICSDNCYFDSSDG